MAVIRLTFDILKRPPLPAITTELALSPLELDAIYALAQIPQALSFYVHGCKTIHQPTNFPYVDNLYSLLANRPGTPKAIRIFNELLILYAENAFAPSTFTARIVTSSLAETYAALSAAVASLSGPLHGGANEQVWHLLDDLRKFPDPESELRRKLTRKERIMGFGHRVFKLGDPRALFLLKSLDKLSDLPESDGLQRLSKLVMKTMAQDRGLLPNIDFPAAQVLHLLGFHAILFTPIFALSRIAGWSAHIMEQALHNKLYNPRSHYQGQPLRHLDY
jgi:citrate synthase